MEGRICVSLSGYMEQLEEIAWNRSQHPNNTRAIRFGKTSYDAHLLGVSGEAATAIHYDKYEQWLESLIYNRGDSGHDLIVGDGFTLQVKTKPRHQYRPWLILDRDLDHSADAYMLVLASPQRRLAELCGWMWTENLLKMPIREIHGAECHIAQEYDLTPCSKREELV